MSAQTAEARPQFYAGGGGKRAVSHLEKMFPRGVIEQMLTERMDFDTVVEDQTHNYAFYRELSFTTIADARTITVIFNITEDYFYHMQEIRMTAIGGSVANWQVPINVSITQTANQRELQNIPIPFSLITTPARALDPVAAIHYAISYNHTFLPHDNIKVELTPVGNNWELVGALHLVVNGYRIPIEARQY